MPVIELLALITPFVALAASLCVIYAIRLLDIVEREPKRIVALAMLLGAFSTVPAIIFQVFSVAVLLFVGLSEEFAAHFNTIVSAPFSEEFVKGAALLALLGVCRSKFNTLVDYLVYACAIGIGFELVENILYQWSVLGNEDQIAGWIDEFNSRTLASAGSHAFFSVWLGFAAWALFKSRKRWGWIMALAAFGVSIILHAFNNLFAVMQELGPADQILPINRLGAALGVVSNQFELALFIGLIGIAVLRDLSFLIDFGSLVQAQLLMEGKNLSSPALHYLGLLINPINHLLASSAWSWSFTPLAIQTPSRSSFREFAMLALDAAKRDSRDPDPAENEARSACVNHAVAMIANIAQTS